MQQRGIVELKRQLSFVDWNLFTNLERYLIRHDVECECDDAGYDAETMAFIYKQQEPRSRNNRAFIEDDLYSLHGCMLYRCSIHNLKTECPASSQRSQHATNLDPNDMAYKHLIHCLFT